MKKGVDCPDNRRTMQRPGGDGPGESKTTMSEQVQIHCHIERSVTATAGGLYYGHHLYRPTLPEWQSVTPEQRESLLEHEGRESPQRTNLGLGEPLSWEAILRAVDAKIAARKVKEAECQAAKERRILEALAMPTDAWIGDGRRHLNAVQYPSVLDTDDRSEPRIVARVEQIKAETLPPLVAEWERRNAEALAKDKASKAAREAAEARQEIEKAELAAKVRRYVLAEVPEYQRAALDDKDVTEVGIKAAVSAVETSIQGAIGDDTVVQWYGSPEEIDVPTSEQYARRDMLRDVATAALASLPDSLRALCSEPRLAIETLDLAPERDRTEYRRAAVVRVHVAGKKASVAWLFEAREGGEE